MNTYVWGLEQVSSLGVSDNFVTFIDDATRELWVYLLRQKYDVFVTFKKWKCFVGNEIGKKVKCLRFDNGGEYCNHEFKDYYSANGIHRQNFFPRTP